MSRTLLTRVSALALAGMLLAGCTGAEDPDPDASTTGTTAPTDDQGDSTGGTGTEQPSGTEAAGPATMPASVDEELAGLDPDALEVLGSASADLDYTDAPVTVEVLRVQRYDGGLDLTFRLTPEEEVSSQKFAQLFSFDHRSTEVNGVRLIFGEEYVAPLTYRADPKWDIADVRCLCSKVPRLLGTEGLVLRASFPDFDGTVDSVSVSVPGFEDIEGIPVQ